MRLKKNIATNEEGFIFNPGTGDSFSTNEIGSEILAMLKEEKTTKEVIESICTKYDVDQSQFEKDLDDYLAQLKDFAILN
jgi:hypothetical protein